MTAPVPLKFIHRFIEPATDGGSARTLLLLHGTGGNESDLLELGRAIDPNAALLSPRGQVLEHGMPRFFRRLAEGVFDEPDLIRRAGELAEFVDGACRHYGRDPAGVVAVGYSNGANIAGALLLLHPETLCGGILFRAMVPLVPATLPDLSQKPVYIGAGDHDPIVPAANTESLAELLRRCGAKVTVSFEQSGHALSSKDVEGAHRWLQERESA